MALDKNDVKILNILQENGSKPPPDLFSATGKRAVDYP
jgi:DNA-binding Lrp family transcriptional regulator